MVDISQISLSDGDLEFVHLLLVLFVGEVLNVGGNVFGKFFAANLDDESRGIGINQAITFICTRS